MFDQDYQYFSKIFLELISINSKFKIIFQAFAPQIFADIESFSKNPNCSCRSKIENFILENKDKCYSFLTNFLTENNINIDFQEIETKYKNIIYAGKNIQVKKSEWFNLYETLKKDKAIFKAFSFIEIDNETLDVYFL
ncbi:MAG: hypothetical protein RIQ48_697 [Pseudomonadota bacterium]|jgi:hypothetical protein